VFAFSALFALLADFPLPLSAGFGQKELSSDWLTEKEVFRPDEPKLLPAGTADPSAHGADAKGRPVPERLLGVA